MKANPAMGRPGRVFGTRELILQKFPYLIPYRVKDNRIEILRVFPTRMNQPDFW
ncbi:type II toxin-antitoxin system RelE/ParE family toxin [Vibrio sp. 1978]|uniref:type II toxin-antitoxin system RelE/ParE family toxin n=1 Tax=Vibrio sp. 1978 TaxID=3074585 RepID=UPI0029670A0C|nr:type II toxin-antitoxin system RelE/ParE family toxin [Vibrio sp. 1978]MDW3059293.1 type II toxin-antitoxin system RelE/ParE family toxin [Vibrio sp. 1978]